jgi:hypothetical protein
MFYPSYGRQIRNQPYFASSAERRYTPKTNPLPSVHLLPRQIKTPKKPSRLNPDYRMMQKEA